MFGIRPKLFVLVLIGFSFLIALTVWRIDVEADKVASASVNTSLHQSSIILDTKMESRYDSIRETVLSLSRDGRVLPLVYDEESATLQDLGDEFKQALAFDILIITDSDGNILARSDRPEAIGHSVAGSSPLFDAALNGKNAQGIFSSQGKLLQIVAAPVFDNIAKDVVRGTIALAYELSPDMAQEINKLTASDISFFIFERDAEGKVVDVRNTYSTNVGLMSYLNTYFSTNPAVWKSLIDTREAKKQLLIPLQDEEYHAVVQPLATSGGSNLGFVMVLRSQTELLKPFMKIQQQVLLVGVICIVIASILAWVIAHNISLPIISLVSVTKKIEEGDYPDPGKYSRSKDEVGLLYDALFRMGKTIKEKAELESYLAQLADDIGDDNLALSLGADISVVAEDLPAAGGDDSLINDTGFPLVKNAAQDAGNATHVDKDATVQKHIELTQKNVATVVDSDEATMMAHTQSSRTLHSPVMAGDLLAAGEVINERYEVIRQLGEGAMGQVYMVKDIDLNEVVALKLLNQKNFTPDIIQFFKDEIRLARRITHRNVLRTFDFGTWYGFYYITMEYVHGYDLAHLISKKGKLDTSIGIVMARQFCSAIKAAHEQGIIHRDLKPSNMMITRQGILKIMDFGLAMQVQSRNDASGADNGSGMVTIAGTPRFMAPEQFVAGDLDQRTDIYAVGVILFMLFTGHPPFPGPGFDELAYQHTNDEPPLLRSILPDAPEGLEKIITRALKKKMEDRYASINELLEDLQAV